MGPSLSKMDPRDPWCPSFIPKLLLCFNKSYHYYLPLLFQKKKQSDSLWSPAAGSPKDEIFIDDEAIEGSGNREIKDDLESSGSGFGPDDEDGEGGSGGSGGLINKTL